MEQQIMLLPEKYSINQSINQIHNTHTYFNREKLTKIKTSITAENKFMGTNKIGTIMP
jgi:hypothetical protein